MYRTPVVVRPIFYDHDLASCELPRYSVGAACVRRASCKGRGIYRPDSTAKGQKPSRSRLSNILYVLFAVYVQSLTHERPLLGLTQMSADPLLSRTVFHVYSCQRLSDMEIWHQDDASIDCNSSSHVLMQVVAAVFILIYVSNQS